MIYGFRRMIYLLCKHDIISVPHTRSVYHMKYIYHIADISSVTAGNGYHCHRGRDIDSRLWARSGLALIATGNHSVPTRSNPLKGQKKKRATYRGELAFWHRGRDSNPRGKPHYNRQIRRNGLQSKSVIPYYTLAQRGITEYSLTPLYHKVADSSRAIKVEMELYFSF